MIALSTVLSMIQIPLMPHGGSITLFSMVPILVMSYRHGAKWGIMTAFVNSLIQLCAGPWQSGILPDPHGTGGLRAAGLPSGLHGAWLCLPDRKAVPPPHRGCRCQRLCGVPAALFVQLSVGYIVWKDYDYAFSWMTEIGFPGISNMSVDGLCWLYSAVYNATYMLPEAILTTVLVVILIRVAPQIFDPQNARA